MDFGAAKLAISCLTRFVSSVLRAAGERKGGH